jgi:hypothetical protein
MNATRTGAAAQATVVTLLDGCVEQVGVRVQDRRIYHEHMFVA